jgi:hypothetical protein
MIVSQPHRIHISFVSYKVVKSVKKKKKIPPNQMKVSQPSSSPEEASTCACAKFSNRFNAPSSQDAGVY